MAFSEQDIQRYSRQLLLPEVGVAGQAELGASVLRLRGDPEALRAAALHLLGAGVRRMAFVPVEPPGIDLQLRALDPAFEPVAAGVPAASGRAIPDPPVAAAAWAFGAAGALALTCEILGIPLCPPERLLPGDPFAIGAGP